MAGVRIGAQQQSAAIQDLTTKVQQITSTGPAFSDPTSKFVVTPGPAPGHVQIAFRTAMVPGIGSVQIYRNLTRDFGSAIQLTEFPASQTEGTDANYADIDAAIAGKVVFYWLRILPSNANNAPIVHGPQQITAP